MRENPTAVDDQYLRTRVMGGGRSEPASPQDLYEGKPTDARYQNHCISFSGLQQDRCGGARTRVIFEKALHRQIETTHSYPTKSLRQQPVPLQ